ncbi:MAG: hypothetical protein U0996_25040 [Planctomycetaceae bacterium]
MIYLNGIALPFAMHGLPVFGAFQRPESVKVWYGVRGAKIFAGRSTTREVKIRVAFTGYATEADFWESRRYFDTLREEGIAGVLVVDACVLPYCVLEEFKPEERPFRDGSGFHGWTQFGEISLRQIAR